MKSSTKGGKIDQTAFGSDPGKPKITMGAGEKDPGRAIDRNVYPSDSSGPGGYRSFPNTSPIYGVQNASSSSMAGSLNDGKPMEQRPSSGPAFVWWLTSPVGEEPWQPRRHWV